MCLGLHDAKNAKVRTAADMTVRQIISLLFDRVAEELGVAPSQSSSSQTSSRQGSSMIPSGQLGSLGGVSDGGGGDEEEAEEEEEGGEEGAGGGGRGALRCAHLVFQVRRRGRGGSLRGG